VATIMLYIIIVLIGSKAVIANFSGLGLYVVAGFVILLKLTVLFSRVQSEIKLKDRRW